MKYPLITLLLLVSLNGIFAQTTDTVFVSVSRDSGALEKNKFIDRYDDAFGTYVPSKWLFKWDLAALLPQTASNYNTLSSSISSALRFSVERKLSPGFSINATYAYGFGYNSFLRFSTIGGVYTNNLSRHEFAIEPRWYFGMKKRMEQGKGANNFSGNYIGLELRHGRRQNAAEDNLPKTEFNAASLRFGLQRRVFKHGYFDISTGLGINHFPATPFTTERTALISDARIGVGLALAKPKTSLEKSPDYCNALQCFREERRMWKVDLYNMLQIYTLDNIKLNLNVAMEQKLGNSPFSVEVSGALSGQTIDYEGFNYTADQLSWGSKLQLQGRYYYNLKKRIAMGKSGNNLSGAYLALQSSVSYSRANIQSVISNVPAEGSYQNTQMLNGLVWGIQYRIFKRAFIDFNLGASIGNTWQENRTIGGPVYNNNYKNEFGILSGLKIGWTF